MDAQQEDSLPPFAWLKSDEDRERKAEFRKAGTFHVIVNPESFEHCEDYRETRDSSVSTVSKGTGSSDGGDDWDPDQSQHSDAQPRSCDIHYSDDPDIVILKIFEDDTRKLLSPGGVASKRQPSTPSTLSAISSTTASSHHEHFQFSYDDTPLMKMADKDGRDIPIIHYFKNFVYRHIAYVHRDSLGTPSDTGAWSAQDVFEQEAGEFVPVSPAKSLKSKHSSLSCQNP